MLISLYLILISLLSLLATAQFPPAPEGVTTIRSQYHNGASLSYKQVSKNSPLIRAYHPLTNSYPDFDLRDDPRCESL